MAAGICLLSTCHMLPATSAVSQTGMEITNFLKRVENEALTLICCEGQLFHWGERVSLMIFSFSSFCHEEATAYRGRIQTSSGVVVVSEFSG